MFHIMKEDEIAVIIEIEFTLKQKKTPQRIYQFGNGSHNAISFFWLL